MGDGWPEGDAMGECGWEGGRTGGIVDGRLWIREGGLSMMAMGGLLTEGGKTWDLGGAARHRHKAPDGDEWTSPLSLSISQSPRAGCHSVQSHSNCPSQFCWATRPCLQLWN